jgi:hypothetical protein
LRAPQFDFKPDQVKIDLIDTSGTFSLVDTELKWREHERLSVMQAALKVEAKEFGSTELLFNYSSETASATLICEPVPTENLPGSNYVAVRRGFLFPCSNQSAEHQIVSTRRNARRKSCYYERK